MNREELIDNIKYIKDVISSSTHYTNISGTASIISGVVATLGCFISSWILSGWQLSEKTIQQYNSETILVWTIVFIISLLSNLIFIIRKAKECGQPTWSRLVRVTIYALSPPIFLGACLTVFFFFEDKILWIPGFWMISYGLGIWSAGLFSIPEPRFFGALFIITGLVTLFFFTTYSLVALAISFGGYHILYGWIIWKRYESGQ